MGVANVPSAAGGGIKSVQRGSAAGSGNVTITTVDVAKSFVTVFGSASSGTVAASAAIGATTVSNPETQMALFSGGGGAQFGNTSQNQIANRLFAHQSNVAATNLSGGTNNLVAAQVTGFLANATTLTVSGACRFEVVEFA